MRTTNPLKWHDIITMTQKWRRIAGVTLPELMVAMAIIGILTGIAAPAFTDLIASQRTGGAAVDIYIALSKARSEAIKRNTSITLRPKTGGWQAGWEIPHPTAATKLDDHNAIAGITITGPDEVIYLNSGRVKGTAVPTFDISATGGASSNKCVTVDLSGLPTQKSSSC